MAKELGFCAIGIQEFLAEIGLQHRKSATTGEIREAIKGVDVSPCRSELKKIGILPVRKE